MARHEIYLLYDLSCRLLDEQGNIRLVAAPKNSPTADLDYFKTVKSRDVSLFCSRLMQFYKSLQDKFSSEELFYNTVVSDLLENNFYPRLGQWSDLNGMLYVDYGFRAGIPV